MSQQTAVFILHPENESFIRSGHGEPANLGVSAWKTALLFLFIIPVLVIVLVLLVSFFSDTSNENDIDMTALIIGGVLGLGVIITGLALIINTFFKIDNLRKNGKLVRGSVDKVNKPPLLAVAFHITPRRRVLTNPT